MADERDERDRTAGGAGPASGGGAAAEDQVSQAAVPTDDAGAAEIAARAREDGGEGGPRDPVSVAGGPADDGAARDLGAPAGDGDSAEAGPVGQEGGAADAPAAAAPAGDLGLPATGGPMNGHAGAMAAAAADVQQPPSAPWETATAGDGATAEAEPAEQPVIHPADVLPPEDGPPGGGEPPGGGRPPGGGGRPPGNRDSQPGDRPMSVVEHLDELRRRLMWMIGALLAGVAVGFYFVKPMVRYLELPLHGLKLYITAPLDPLFAFVKISVAFGLVVASPVILYQLVAYVLPALTRLERRLLFSYLPAATGLFIAGLAFGFYVFIPLVIGAMLRFAGTTLTPILTIDKYISFLLSFTLPFGIVFEMPIIVVTLVRLGILSPGTLAAGRRWALMVTIVIAAIFAPPDPITPLVMALPIYGLYEVSIWVARLAARRRAAE